MYKYVLTICAIVALLSCSSDDENSSNVNDPILGKWNLFSIDNVEQPDCEKMSTIEFKTNNSTVSETFQTVNTDCIKIEGTNTWENKGESLYTFNNIESQIEFSDDNTTMKILNGNTVYKKQ
ncbi:hypothetical protein [Tenacibaculum agarivorans]|uniref:hypothetical protein n=1 Tax=Tenacibaculum agarivorans TaxID=1908389 RepID=UPI00094B7B2D|nr:hypothetical protein [Tenacibaculum agarivorans]